MLLRTLAISTLLMTTSFAEGPTMAKAKPEPLKKTAGASDSKLVIPKINIKVQVVESKKGFKAWLVENHDLSVVSFNLAFRHAGSKCDPKGKAGLASILADMLDEGVGDMDSEAFSHYLLEKNIKASASAGRDEFLLKFYTTKESMKDAFALLKLTLTKPRFDAKPLARLKNQTKVGLEQALQSDGTVAGDLLKEVIFGKDHPYATSTKDHLNALNSIMVEDMRQFMKERFAKEQIVIAVAGDITPDELKQLMDKTFDFLPEKAKPHNIKDVELQNLGQTRVQEMPIPQSRVMFVQPGIRPKDPDFFPAFVMNKIFGGNSFTSTLWEEIREKRGIAYHIGTYLHYNDHAKVYMGMTATSNKNVGKAVQVIREQWQKLAKEGVSEKDLFAAKKRMIGSFALNFDTTGGIAGALLGYQLENFPSNYINIRNDKVAAVTSADVKRVIKNLIQPDKLTFVIVGQPKDLVEKKAVSLKTESSADKGAKA